MKDTRACQCCSTTARDLSNSQMPLVRCVNSNLDYNRYVYHITPDGIKQNRVYSCFVEIGLNTLVFGCQGFLLTI